SFRKTEALTLESDCWLLGTRVPKFANQRWAVKLQGPGPLTGRWIELKSEDPTGEKFWQWQPFDEENDPFIKEQGFWIFQGSQPKFTEEVWVFSGSCPSLTFYFEGESYGAKLSCDESGVLYIAEDSQTAQALLPLLVDSLTKVFKKKSDRI